MPTVANLLEQTDQEIKNLEAHRNRLLRQRVSRFDDTVLEIEQRIDHLYRLRDEGIPLAEQVLGELGDGWGLTGHFDLTDDASIIGVAYTSTSLEFYVGQVYDYDRYEDDFSAMLVDGGGGKRFFDTVDQVADWLRVVVEDLHPSQTRLWT